MTAIKLNRDAKIFVAGHRGLVGSAITRKLKADGFSNLLLRTRQEVDLENQAAVRELFKTEKPDYVFLAAAKVGGILANSKFRGDFIQQNLMIQTNVISSAFESGVKKLVFLGSSCIYPKLAPQPMREDALLTGLLEETNEAYAVANIAGIMHCKSLMLQYGRPFISLMPTNLYGPGDNYDPQNSHVLPGLIRKFHEAKVGKLPAVTAWGTGSPLREFLHSDDLASAAVYCLENYNEVPHLNVGSGDELMIRDLAQLVKKVVEYPGDIVWDASKPDGTPRKLMDSSRLFALGWRPQVKLEDGIRRAYQDFLTNHASR